MKIRSITAFIPLLWPFDEGSITGIAAFLRDARKRLNQAGIEVQSIRLATPPFLDVIGDPDPAVLIEFAKSLETIIRREEIDVVSIGPVVATTPHALIMSIHALPQLITETEHVYSGVLFADNKSGINLTAAHAFAHAVYKVAHNTPNGSGNLRLAGLSNIPSNVPYFPAAFHRGGLPSFGLATEGADLAVWATRKARSLDHAQQNLIRVIEKATNKMLSIVDDLVDDHQLRFEGVDFSLAPYPDAAHSLGLAMEQLGIDAFGGNGTLFATKFLANCIQQADIPHTGFCGVMLPILQDSVLAQRVSEGHFGLNDLLLYSAVRGTGLDMLPLPGDTKPEELAAVFLDMAALAVANNQPLTARLLPIPGLKAGDEVNFDSEEFAISQVLPVKGFGAQKLMERASFLKTATPRKRTKSKSGQHSVFHR